MIFVKAAVLSPSPLPSTGNKVSHIYYQLRVVAAIEMQTCSVPGLQQRLAAPIEGECSTEFNRMNTCPGVL